MTGKTVRDRSGLLLGGFPAPSDVEINQAELLAIAGTGEWVRKTKFDVCSIRFWKRLHQEMFGSVWSWAGAFKTTRGNIGVEPYQVPTELRKLEDDFKFWVTEQTMVPAQLLARLHHRLAWIHPFVDGNGRWARLATDAAAYHRMNLDFLVWAQKSQNLRDIDSQARNLYINAICEADTGNFANLVIYLRSLNPSL